MWRWWKQFIWIKTNQYSILATTHHRITHPWSYPAAASCCCCSDAESRPVYKQTFKMGKWTEHHNIRRVEPRYICIEFFVKDTKSTHNTNRSRQISLNISNINTRHTTNTLIDKYLEVESNRFSLNVGILGVSVFDLRADRVRVLAVQCDQSRLVIHVLVACKCCSCW